jgi:hypothetical protein
VTATQVKDLVARLGDTATVPLFVFDAGYDPIALTADTAAQATGADPLSVAPWPGYARETVDADQRWALAVMFMLVLLAIVVSLTIEGRDVTSLGTAIVGFLGVLLQSPSDFAPPGQRPPPDLTAAKGTKRPFSVRVSPLGGVRRRHIHPSPDHAREEPTSAP